MNAPVTPPPLLRVERLSKSYLLPGKRPFKVMNEVSFELRERKTLGIVGESGCGKSTLGRTLMRLTEASGGAVEFAGVDWISPTARLELEHRRLMQIVFQDPYSSLNPKHSIGQILREPLDINCADKSRAERMQVVRELLGTVGLAASDVDKYPHEFSGGQRQRIAIARALALEPQLLVADEPVSALDVSIQSQILNLLMELRRQRNMAMIFISHDLSVIRHISDEVAVMYFGSIVEMAPMQQLFAQPAHPYTRLLLSAIPKRHQAGIATEGAPQVELAAAELPDPANPPPGCAFAKRCPHAMARCATEVPALRAHQQGTVACWLY
jgi:oligopeptide/dipeptide ABC transporter ATP-binding protein